MAQTAIISPQILDSSAIGRSVITAEDLAAAQSVLGIVPFDVTADYNFTGDLTFSGDNKHYFIGEAGDANTAYLTTQYDGVNGQIASLATGSQTRRPLYVGGVSNGTDSGILVGGSPAGYLRTGANTSVAWSSSAFVTYKDFRPQTDGDVECGRDGNRWGSVYSVDGNFSGTVTANTITSSGGNLTLKKDGANALIFGGQFIQCYQDLRPALTNTWSSGNLSQRWSNVYSVNGSFTGNLDTEVGGSNRIFNLGDDSLVAAGDTEYLEISASSNTFSIFSKATGSGVQRPMYMGNATEYLRTSTNGLLFYTESATRLNLSANFARFYSTYLIPNTSGTSDLGRTTERWRGVYAQDGNFSGDVTAASVIGTSNLNLQSNGGNSFLSLANSGSISITAYGAIYQQFTTAGVAYRKDCLPTFDNANSLGLATNRWSGVYGVDGDFSGILTASEVHTGVLASEAGWYLRVSGYAGAPITPARNFNPYFDNMYHNGADGRRWSNVASYDGSFAGNLDTEVGGSNRLFNLGSDADVAAGDTEYLETSFNANVATIATKKTGAGTTRSLLLDVNNQMQLNLTGSDIYFAYAGLNRFYMNTTTFAPWGSGKRLGGAGDRWASFHSVEGDFSGSVIMAANVDFTGLPTSDPSVAGRLWNDGGTVKISAG